LIATGDVLAARLVLESARSSGDAGLLLKLGQTYDPLQLAAWNKTAGVDGNGVASVDTARSLYLLAEMAGSPKARVHLDRLRGWQAGTKGPASAEANGQGWVSRAARDGR